MVPSPWQATEIGAGINTGIIRSMGSTGTVVTAAGLVFAFTMGAMISGDLLNVGQGGMTIGIGLLLDTLIVRSLMTPSIAAILGPWFWWPLKVRSRPSYSERMRSVHQRGEHSPAQPAPTGQEGGEGTQSNGPEVSAPA